VLGPSGELAKVLPGGAGESPLLQAFPELRDSPGPDWLREGVRVTYRVQSATIADAYDEGGAAGAGFVQYDLVALGGGLAVSSLKFYLDTGSSIIPSFVLPSWGIPGAGDYWLDPKALENAEDAANSEVTVTRLPTTIGGEQYQAVRFEYKADEAEFVWVYDEVSGILLFYRHAIGDGDKQLADSTLMGRRQVKLPWRGGSLPDWVREGSSLRYEGTYSVGVAGSPAVSFPYSVEATVKRTGQGWSEFEVSDYVSGRLNGSSSRVSGVAQTGDAFWLPEEALRALRDGQRLDRDPVTGAEVTVSRGESGTITLTETGATYTIALTYDESDGALLAMEQQVSSGFATTAIQLQLVERR